MAKAGGVEAKQHDAPRASFSAPAAEAPAVSWGSSAQRSAVDPLSAASTVRSKEALKQAIGHSCLIDEADLEIGVLVGKGGFAQVFRAKWHGGRTPGRLVQAQAGATTDAGGSIVPVAVKLLAKPSSMQGSDSAVLKAFCNEVTLWSKIQHPNIVQLYGLCVGRDASLALVTELLPLGSVFDRIHQRPSGARIRRGQ